MKDKFAMVGQKIPEFTLPSTQGDHVNIHSFAGMRNVTVFLLRGLMDPFCQQQVFRLGKDREKFEELNTEIYAITADRYENAKRLELRYAKGRIPIYFDRKRDVTKLLKQEVKILRLGRLPAILIIDKNLVIQYAHYGEILIDIPSNKKLLKFIETLDKD